MKASEVGISLGAGLESLGNFILVGTCLVEISAVSPGAEGEVGGGDFVTDNVLVGLVSLKSLFDDLEPVGKSRAVVILETLSLGLLSGSKGGLVERLNHILVPVEG